MRESEPCYQADSRGKQLIDIRKIEEHCKRRKPDNCQKRDRDKIGRDLVLRIGKHFSTQFDMLM